MASIDLSLIPAGLATLLPNPRTPWHISQPLFDRMQKEGAGAGAPTKPFKACPVISSDPEFAFIMKYFNHSKPKNFGIRNIVCIHNADASNVFEPALLQAEKSAAGFPPSWQEEEPKAERAAAITRWRKQAEQFSPLYLKTAQRVEKLTVTKVVPLWHGTSRAEAICSNGFAFFGKHALFKNANNTGPSTDIGYFGSGIYFTNNAQYATMYSANKVGGTILLAWVAMREPFPVVSDQPVPREGSDMTMLKGKGAYKNYNAHYIPVTSTDPSDPENMQYHPCHRSEQPAWDEYVVFHSSQTLARFQIELGVDFPASPSPAVAAGPIKSVENLLDKILEMLDAPLIQADTDLVRLLTTKSEALTALDLMSPLSAKDQEIYGYTSKLLDAAGKPRNVIRQKLIQLLGNEPAATPSPAISVAPIPAPGPAAASAGPGPGYGVGHLTAIPPAVMPLPPAPAVPSGADAKVAAAAVSPLKSASTIPEMEFGTSKWVKSFGKR